mmetsp:Transcript_9304/g.15683  ORF Transcript_9304/g.15683 Transcript_9304/m.15683 type:complete len:84 (-) Transcript_9304:216-467(-)
MIQTDFAELLQIKSFASLPGNDILDGMKNGIKKIVNEARINIINLELCETIALLSLFVIFLALQLVFSYQVSIASLYIDELVF